MMKMKREKEINMEMKKSRLPSLGSQRYEAIKEKKKELMETEEFTWILNPVNSLLL